jgi:hypothetical protein
MWVSVAREQRKEGEIAGRSSSRQDRKIEGGTGNLAIYQGTKEGSKDCRKIKQQAGQEN